MSSAAFLDAEAAAGRLKVSRATLYAYVSRGFIRAHAEDDDPRRRRYSTEDVERLVARKARGRRPDRIAETTLDFGVPVLPSRITLIDGGRLFFRGRDAARLAETASLEEVAEILWDCDAACFGAETVPPAAWGKAAALAAHLPPIERCLALMPFVEAGGRTTWQRDRARLLLGAVDLLRHMTAAVAGVLPSAAPSHEVLAQAWGLDTRGADLVRRALVLIADHELNASTFAVRVVASTGASLALCITGGLSALSGPRHGGASRRVDALFAEIARAGDAERVVVDRLARGEMIPGCGHQLYRDADPRSVALLANLPPDAERDALLKALSDHGVPRPNIDFALVSMTRAIGLPDGTASALFAVGRTAGWIAHALEQVAEGRLIRPRARYIGVGPES